MVDGLEAGSSKCSPFLLWTAETHCRPGLGDFKVRSNLIEAAVLLGSGLAITLGDSPETENLGAVLWTSDPVSDLILVSSDPGLWFRLSQTCFLNLRPKFVV